MEAAGIMKATLPHRPHALAIHLTPTRSPILIPVDSAPGPNFAMIPTPS
jgi:hypothetical protein